ncbi:hypothetical protein [Citrobacter portucalensis]|uniref:hypothetical protein n=1 Tax=Citrobacter portucalensis TaxID=1639133 RepID=UPI0011DD7948|nr:hypothetical protein [Citrobacter portucalensis]QEH56854.1 hypothetical protein FXN82_16040 [Citrobacter portucalensis]
MISPYTEKQKQSFLTRFGQKIKINDKDALGIVEIEINNDNGQVSETLYITADINSIKQDDSVLLNEILYNVAYLTNDGSGLVNCYLTYKTEQETSFYD